MDHPTQRLLERTHLPESYPDRLRGAIKGLSLPRGTVHARMPDGSFAVFRDAGGKKRLVTFLSKHMNPPGRDVTPVLKEKLMKKSANHMVEPSPDGGNYMAVSNLKSLKRNSEELMLCVDAGSPLPDWVESKLNVAAASIDDVADWFRNGGELNKTSDFNPLEHTHSYNGREWDVSALVEASKDLPVQEIDPEQLWDELKLGDKWNWDKKITHDDLLKHLQRINDAELDYPVILSQDRHLMDGMHRILKARVNKNPSIKYRQFEVDPESRVEKKADFANETLAQKAHDQVVKEYGLTPQDGSQYWRLKTRIYKSMGGTFTGKRAKKASIPEDAVVYTAVPDIDSVMLNGLLSSEALDQRPDLLEIARPDPDERQAWKDKLLKDKRRLHRKGPNVFFSQPDPEKIHDNHNIKKHDLKLVEVALGKLLKDQPSTRVYGMELEPYPTEPVDKFPKRKGVLSHKKLRELLDKSPQELWQHYDDPEGKYYAANVPHGAVLTPTGVIEPKYLKQASRKVSSMNKKAAEAYRPRVELFIHDGEGNVLANKSDKGWQFPGGGIEEGQDIFEAAKREALEEAGYNIKKLKTLSKEPSKIPWPEWYKEVARKKGRGHFEGQLTHPIVAQIGKKNEKLYGSEGDALTKLKFVPIKKLIRDGEKRLSPDHDDITDNNGQVIPGFGVFTRDTLKHLKTLESKLSGNKTAGFSLMSVAKDLRKTAGVYELMLKQAEEGLKPPAAVASAARRGLELRRKASPSNKGGLTASEASKQGIGSGVQRASNLANGDSVSPSTVKRMHSFFSRHEGNSAIDPEHKGKPQNDKGYVSHLLWGGDAGKRWAASQSKKLDAKKEAALLKNPFAFFSKMLNNSGKQVTRREMLKSTANQLGVEALSRVGENASRGGSLATQIAAAGAAPAINKVVDRRQFFRSLGAAALPAAAASGSRAAATGAGMGTGTLLNAAHAAAGASPHSRLVGALKNRQMPGLRDLAGTAEHVALSNPRSVVEGALSFV